MNTLNANDEATLFIAGALSALENTGLSEADAQSAAYGLYKSAARRYNDVDDEDDDEGTWWSRNKHWALPTAIGAGAFLVGADAGRYGDRDKSYLTNAGSLLLKRIEAILGLNIGPFTRAATEVKKPTPVEAVTGNSEESQGDNNGWSC